MAQLRIYLTLPLIMAAIQEVLSTEPYCFYEKLLLAPESRKRLIVSVFTQARCGYQVFIDNAKALYFSAVEPKFLLKNLIHQEMNYLIREHDDRAIYLAGLTLRRSPNIDPFSN
ncbi:MAG: hypothetical protein MUC48_02565 [Leptolyngbya sp. Prado105]|jgi:hypothetical protein|nr:hypothetical protein [Leptolyngbya sp. Prado105]